MQKSRDNKKTKDLYNDQTYESISQNRNVSYSISLQMINKNAIIFLSKEYVQTNVRKSDRQI